MVVPVPVVQEKDVKALDRAVLDRVDLLAAPRLVEYWEQDPCAPQEYDGQLEQGARASDFGMSNFQARYIIRDGGSSGPVAGGLPLPASKGCRGCDAGAGGSLGRLALGRRRRRDHATCR